MISKFFIFFVFFKNLIYPKCCFNERDNVSDRQNVPLKQDLIESYLPLDFFDRQESNSFVRDSSNQTDQTPNSFDSFSFNGFLFSVSDESQEVDIPQTPTLNFIEENDLDISFFELPPSYAEQER